MCVGGLERQNKAKLLAAWLLGSHSVQMLDLRGAGLQPAGAVAIGRALQHNSNARFALKRRI